ncbi:hypothetical protein ACFL6I_25335 [candidate division KSB1 bacterium]
MPKLLLFILLLLIVRNTFSQKNNTSPQFPKTVFNEIEDMTNMQSTGLVHDSIDWHSYGIQIHKQSENYFVQLNNIYNQIQEIRHDSYKELITMDSVSSIFTETLVNVIIPYWYGTDWTFNEKVDTPQNGAIACGYFVAITLNHIGININRNKFSSLLPANMVYTLALNDTVYSFEDSRSKEVITFIKKNLEEGLYLTGLFNHVGYLLYRNSEIFFIHANYFEPTEVIIEKASDSKAFSMGKHYYITAVSANKTLIKRWLNGIRIFIVMRNKY